MTAVPGGAGMEAALREAVAAVAKDCGRIASVLRLERAIEAALPHLSADRDALAAEVERWRSGQRRLSWPTIESVPDGLTFAARLVRAQGTEGGDDHDALLRDAAMRLKALHEVAGPLLAQRERLRADLAKANAALDDVRAVLAEQIAKAIEDDSRVAISIRSPEPWNHATRRAARIARAVITEATKGSDHGE